MRILSLLVVLTCAWLGTARADFLMVKNAKNPTPALTVADAKAVFTGRTKTWSNGEAIVLVIGSQDSPAMAWLAQSFYAVSAKTFLAKIKQDVFRGEVRHPVSADDDAKTIARVEAGVGVVGWVTPAAARSLPPGVVLLPVR